MIKTLEDVLGLPQGGNVRITRSGSQILGTISTEKHVKACAELILGKGDIITQKTQADIVFDAISDYGYNHGKKNVVDFYRGIEESLD